MNSAAFFSLYRTIFEGDGELLILSLSSFSLQEHLTAAMIPKNSRCFMFYVLFFLCFSIHLNLSEGVDSITANQSLSGSLKQTIVSAGETFELGFFTRGNSSRYYVGIWYKNVSQQTIVWVANREKPITDINSAELKILDGNLVLVDKSQDRIWSTNVSSTTSNSLVATLNDNGNLVLRDGSEPRTSEGFWQSFDHPADTWLPGGKIAYDKRTKAKQLLISWKNSEDPAPGLFSLELDPNGSQYIIKWNRTQQYWTSGAWNGHIFSLVPEMRLNYIYNFSYEDNINETYFTYSLYNPSLISRFVMDISGQIQQSSWSESTKEWNLFWSQPRQQCQVYAYCGAFGICNQNSLPFCNCLSGFKQKSVNDWNLKEYSGGCVREIDLLQCGNGSTSTGRKDKFLRNPQVSLPVNSQTVIAGSAGECESVCLNNCSCTAYSYDGNACLVWKGEIMNLQQLPENDGSGRTIYVRLAASAPQFSSNKKNKGVVIGAVVGSVAVVVVLLAVMGIVIWRRQKSRLGTSKAVEGSLVAFGYKDLQIATKNFSDKLGGGGFGSVFKGMLPDSTVIAVKKLESISQGEKQFRTEVSTIGTIQHVNLIRLHGFCSEGDRKLLVYEYMENGSLDSHLFNVEESKILDWRTRYQIMLGIARGLTYLHEKCRDCIIHCDIKPENILLDTEFCPKVADFGLAKLVGRDFSRVLTTLRGTRGYLAPEWISGVAITAKADVYSYGMMVFEFLSGRRNSEQSVDGMVKFFPSLAASVIAEGGDILDLLDPALDKNADAEEVAKLCKVACWCIQDEENIRPSMGHVVQILEGVMDVNLPPIPRSLKLFVESQEQIMFFTDSSSGQSSQTKSDASRASSHSKGTTK
ncbi:G-type lectin S-receptor-like serine/threonine-protein kinase At2g19130 [Olea europaea var. sylvestris]|uniref:Receptor-like serine/threonine-protein kinase n=1 Tax=Olea europaea subsp. europaea TaxID=158383 RepID=A0A8S0PLA9_OLEEU|nr:G-type lectin S-receptor-like serine/threonine-protein kinase At2g19130 [Olea europaea var. sylvestris]CAA2954137.1 G-type lectin S-receptor-like serine threonine-kinase At2g19130 [Olea europaea subsp. europaea]